PLLSAHDTVAQKDYEPVSASDGPTSCRRKRRPTRTVCLSSLQRHRKPPSPRHRKQAPPLLHFRPKTFPDHVAVLNILLEDFKELQEGLEPAPKLINNVQSKLHRIRQFVGWMSHGNTNLGKLLFLGNMGRLRGWVKSLRTNMMSLTTTLHYLKNVRQFVVFIQETPPPSSCLSKTNLRRVVRELKASIKSWVRPVVLHQMRVKEKKDATMHSMKELQECRRLALVAIPKLLSQLEKHHTYLDQCSLFGYVTAYLASLYEPDKIREARLVGHELRGEATFSSLRSAVATFARDRHGNTPRSGKLCRALCATTRLFLMEQARRGRLLFEQAQKEGEESDEPQKLTQIIRVRRNRMAERRRK
ncbi:hypothetical protein KUCAC02_001218, partial [Chaenocephalus aceratus]